jgi:MoxR-like ATPase
MTNNLLNYKGIWPPPQTEQGKKIQIPPYVADKDKPLLEAVNLAIFLERPLLVKGEPGCGKTRLAEAVANELGLPYYAWHIKSTERARDGLYTFDAVARLRDVQLAAASHATDGNTQQIGDPTEYRKWGKLGQAFMNDQRSVVLIDEIDKADIDFPNDLLLELDQKEFYVQETGETIKAKHAPIIFITSNDEKDLPDAFLRRCLFLYITFPTPERLIDIINAHFPASPEVLVTKAVNRFQQLRTEMQRDKQDAGKKVSTSELIDWFRVLRDYPEDKDLAELDGKLPYPSVLLKSWDDHRRYLEQEQTGSSSE